MVIFYISPWETMNHADFEKFWGHFLDWFFTHNSSPFTKEAIFGFLEGDEPPGCRVNRTEKSVVKNASGLPKCVENMQKWFGCVIFWNYCTALRVYNLYTWYFSRVKALNSFQCWVEVVKFWHFKEPFSCLHRPWCFFFHKNPGTSMRSIYSHPFQSWLKLKDVSSCFLLFLQVTSAVFGTFTCKPVLYSSDFGGISVASPSKTLMFSRFLRLPRSLLSANPRGETGDQRQGSGEPCNRATVQPHGDSGTTTRDWLDTAHMP